MMNPIRIASVCAALTVIAVAFVWIVPDMHPPDSDSVKSVTGGVQREASRGENRHGIDVSYHSGTVHWDSVASQGFAFAFVKATEGNDLKDPAYDSHWQELKKAGITRGAYHFYVTEDAPETQAQFYIDNVVLEPGDLAPVVDIESLGHHTASELADRLTVFLAALEDHYGVRPIIYTSPIFWNDHLSADFGHYPLWVAEYGVEQPRIPNGWEDWDLWQWKGDTTIAGVQKTADITRTNAARSDLTALMIPERTASRDLE